MVSFWDWADKWPNHQSQERSPGTVKFRKVPLTALSLFNTMNCDSCAGRGGGQSEVFQFLRHAVPLRCGAGMPGLSLCTPCMQTISTIFFTQFFSDIYQITIFISLRIGWWLWCWWWSVMVTRGVTGTRTLDIGSCESHLSHISFVSLQADSQTHGTRTRVHEVQWMRECF